MNGKIGLEEHFAIAQTLHDSAGFVPGDYWKELSKRLLDIHGSMRRSICTRATRCRVGRRSTTAIRGCSGRPGPSARRRRCTHCG